MEYGGWYQVAFERDLKETLTTVRIAEKKLLCVRRGEGEVEIYDAVCPHRGADLGVGGRLEDDGVVCPYHGHKVALGLRRNGFCVRRYQSLTVAGLVFALMGDAEPGVFPEFIAEIARTHQIFPGFEKTIRVPPEMVIENAFDWAHFKPVHDVIEVRTEPPWIEQNVFMVRTQLRVGPSAWQGADADPNTFIDVPLFARAFSPNLTVTQIAVGGGDHPHHVIAAGTPRPDGLCTVRLSVALPLGADGSGADQELARTILEFESFGLEQDRPVWENLTLDATPAYTNEDATVLAFRNFCKRFKFQPEGGFAGERSERGEPARSADYRN